MLVINVPHDYQFVAPHDSSTYYTHLSRPFNNIITSQSLLLVSFTTSQAASVTCIYYLHFAKTALLNSRLYLTTSCTTTTTTTDPDQGSLFIRLLGSQLHISRSSLRGYTP